MEWEIEDAWMPKSSRQNRMLVMHEGQWRLDMKNVAVIVVFVLVLVVAINSSFVCGCSMTVGVDAKKLERKGVKCE